MPSHSISESEERWNSEKIYQLNLSKSVKVKMENYSVKSRRLSVESIELVCDQKYSARVQRKSIFKKFHQPFNYISTHTKTTCEGQILRNVKQLSGKSPLSIQNFLWRYNIPSPLSIQNFLWRYNIPKNAHEKERSSIEKDIHDDSCDFVHVVKDKEVKMSTNNPNETAKGSCYSKPSDDPPFMIYSLEDFPTISASCKSAKPVVNKLSPSPDKTNEGFVVVPTEASISTPSFTPKRISLCEKFIKSPTKLFPKPIPFVLKPILKAPRRRFSECSNDDFIVFADDDCDADEEDDDDMCSDIESETDSETDDSDDEVFEEEEDETSDDEDVDECDNNKRSETPERQIDSGVEERRVHFNLNAKVHVMRVWDYAYRAYRKGDYWQQMARDHERFKKRISEQQKVLNPILDASHREKIFRQRFQ